MKISKEVVSLRKPEFDPKNIDATKNTCLEWIQQAARLHLKMKLNKGEYKPEQDEAASQAYFKEFNQSLNCKTDHPKSIKKPFILCFFLLLQYEWYKMSNAFYNFLHLVIKEGG